MRTIEKSELHEILKAHKLWLESGGTAGVRADFFNSHLTGSNFKGENLQSTDFSGADLRWSNFRHAELQSANLRNANLMQALMDGAGCQDADLCDANLMLVQLRGADLRRATLLGANLRDSDLRFVDLREAKFNINIRDCYSFKGAKFTSDALPWLILHPDWMTWKESVQIEGV